MPGFHTAMRDPRTPLTEKSTRRWVFALTCLLFLLRVPFLLTHHMQEDAFITFRAARRLAEQGDFSFNAHAHFPGTTSLLYPLIVAALDLLLHSGYILGVQLFGIACTIGACFLAAKALGSGGEPRRAWLGAWVLAAAWPLTLLLSFTGMETPLVLLAVGGAMYGLRFREHWGVFLAALFLLPLIRPDAVAYGLIFGAAMFFLDRRKALSGLLALGVGSGLLAFGNHLLTGEVFPSTMGAKELAYHPSHTFSAVLHRFAGLFLGQSFLLPVTTSYLLRLAPVMVLLVLWAFVVAFRSAHGREERVLLAAMAAVVLAVPFAYAVGGVIFEWYLYPAHWAALMVAVSVFAPTLLEKRRSLPLLALVLTCWAGLDALQWVRSLVGSTQDYHYRADIGRYLREVSGGQGTLFLEPAGYIPYFSGLTTDDEVGLVSPRISEFMRRDPAHWFFNYIAADQPTYIVQRESFARFQPFNGPALTPPEQHWFLAHYTLLRRTHFDPARYHPSPLFRRFWALGPMPDYLVYRRNALP